MAPPEPVYDPAVLARVRHLHLRARVLTDALLQGEHRSRRVGQAIEFAGYQEYLPGLDLRRLDWRVLARADRLVVKTFETETELPITVVLDLSADLATGAPGRRGWARRLLRANPKSTLPDLDDSKAGISLTLAATLLYFFHLHREPIGLELIAGEGSGARSLRTRSGRSHLQACFLALAAARPSGRASLGETLAKLGDRTRRRSLVLVISDGMEEPAEWLPAIAAFARRRTDLRFVHVFDPREWSLEIDQPARLYSPEGGDDLAVDPQAARSALQDVAREYVEEVRAGIAKWGGVYVPAPLHGGIEGIVQRVIRGRPAPPDSDPFAELEGA